MNAMIKRVISGSLLWLFFVTILFCQIAVNMDGEKEHPKLEVSMVPKVVTDRFLREYPVTSYESWYGYPSFVNISDWYDYDPKRYSDKYPEYYIVEFMQNNSPHKTIYSQNGDRIVSYRRLNSDSPISLPVAILDALKQGEYKQWNVELNNAVIILREYDQMKVYRIEIVNGSEKHRLFFQTDGDQLNGSHRGK